MTGSLLYEAVVLPDGSKAWQCLRCEGIVTDLEDHRDWCPVDPKQAPDDRVTPSWAPVLPYPSPTGPTSGYAEGVATSEEHVRDMDADGRTAKQQRQSLLALTSAGSEGRTWRELDRLTGWGHGSTSRVLSDLHKAGKIARLTERRYRCFVYVLPEHVEGRETQEQGRPRQPQDGLALAALQAEHKLARIREALDPCQFTLPGMDCPGLAVNICQTCRIRRILDGQ